MALIDWTDELSTGLESVDSQHKKLVSMVNNMHDGMKWGRGNDVLGVVLNDLVKYTVYHFGHEEELMDKYDYPDTVEHKKQHAALVDEVGKFVADFNAGKTPMSLEVLNFLKDWLAEHIVGSDKKFGPYLKSMGAS